MIDNSEEEDQMADAFIRAVGALQRNAYVIDGIVTAVGYPQNYTCTVTIGTAPDTPVTLPPVLMRVLSTSQASFLEIPAVGSNCIICFRDGKAGRPQLLWVDKADKLLLNYGLIQANGGNNGGMINVEPAVTRYNLIENDVNSLKNAFMAWVVVPNDGGAALKAIAAAWAGNPLAVTTRDEIEDTKFTH